MEKINVFVQEIIKKHPNTKSNLSTFILFVGMVSLDLYTIETPLLIPAIEPVAEEGIHINKEEYNKVGFKSKMSRLEYLKSMNTSTITKIVSKPMIKTIRVILRQIYRITFRDKGNKTIL